VTTPPSKGLVVELYLIYFGLAQSFVDVFNHPIQQHFKMKFSTVAVAVACVASTDAFTFRAQPSSLVHGKHSVAEMVSSYLDNLSASPAAPIFTPPAVSEPVPTPMSNFEMDSGSAMGSYLDALGNGAFEMNGGGVSMGTYLLNLGGGSTHLNKPIGSTSVAGYLDVMPSTVASRQGGAGLNTYVDFLGGNAPVAAAPVPAAAAPAAPVAPRAVPKANFMSAYDQQMAAAMAASRPAAPAAPVAAPAAAYTAPAPVQPMSAIPQASQGGLKTYTDLLATSTGLIGGAGVITHVDALYTSPRVNSGAGVVTHVDALMCNSPLSGGAGLRTYTDNLAVGGSTSPVSSFSAPPAAVAPPAQVAYAPPAPVQAGAPKPRGSGGFGGYLDGL
jgi:hypothetical protein